MENSESEEEKLLREIGQQLHKDAEQNHPLSQEHRDQLMDAAGAGWEKHQEEIKEQADESVQEKKSAEQERKDRQNNDQQQDRDR